jgi:hypothetical protein
MDSGIFQKQYDFEMTRKNTLSSSLNIPIVALTVLGGAASSMILKYEYSYNISTYIFIAVVSISICFSAYALILAFKSQVGYWHHKIPSSGTLSNYYKDLITWYVAEGSSEEEARVQAESDFDDYLNRKLSEASDANGENNLKRGAYLNEANVKIAIALLFLALSSPFFIYANLTKNESPSKIEIVNPIHLKSEETTMPPEENENSNSSNSNTTSGTQPQPAEKPAEPSNVLFKDNSQVTESKGGGSSDKK